AAAEGSKNQGVDSGLQAAAGRTCTHSHRGHGCGESQKFQISWYQYQQGSELDTPYWCGYKDSETEALFSAATAEICMDCTVLTNFYRCTIETILTGRITTWFGNSTAQDRKTLQ